jgi:nitrous oxidase accessory protein
MRTLFIAVILAVGLPIFSFSQEVVVRPGESLQTAIDAAPAGAVIVLSEGRWEENVKIEKSLTLRGTGADVTVISGVEEGYPVVWIAGPDGGSRFRW